MTDEDAPAREIEKMLEDGLAALEDEQYEVAAERFRRVIRLAPFRHDARDYLAFTLDQQFARESGRPPARPRNQALGASSAAAATSRRPRPARIRFPGWLAATGLALAVFVIAVVALGRRHDLREWVQNLNKPPGNPVVEGIAADLEKVDGAVAREQFDEALKLLEAMREKAAQIEPPNPKLVEDKIAEVYAAKAQVFVANRNYPKALEAAQEGLKHNAALPQLNYLAGKCYERKGIDAVTSGKAQESKNYYRMAIQALEKAVDPNTGDPNDVQVLDLLAKCYTWVNEEAKALETWQRICKLAPTSNEGKRAAEYLRSKGF